MVGAAVSNGVDIRIEFANGSLMYAQCKHYHPSWEGVNKVDYIGMDQIRAFKWCMERDKVQRGYYFSTVPFSEPAKFIAKVNGIEPIYYDPDSKKAKAPISGFRGFNLARVLNFF